MELLLDDEVFIIEKIDSDADDKERKAKLITEEIKSNIDCFALDLETKRYLLDELVSEAYLLKCNAAMNRRHGWICVTGLEGRLRPARQYLCHVLTDAEVVFLSFELGVLKDDCLLHEMETRYGLDDKKKNEALRILKKMTPAPFFHGYI